MSHAARVRYNLSGLFKERFGKLVRGRPVFATARLFPHSEAALQAERRHLVDRRIALRKSGTMLAPDLKSDVCLPMHEITASITGRNSSINGGVSIALDKFHDEIDNMAKAV